MPRQCQEVGHVNRPCPCQEKEHARVKQLQKEDDDRKFISLRCRRRGDAREQMIDKRGPWDTEKEISLLASKELREYEFIMREKKKKWDEQLKSSNRFYMPHNKKAEIHAEIARQKKNAEFVKAELEAKLTEARTAELRRWAEEAELATSFLKEAADREKDRAQTEDNLWLHERWCMSKDDHSQRRILCSDCKEYERDSWGYKSDPRLRLKAGNRK